MQICLYIAPNDGIGSIISDNRDMLSEHGIDNTVFETINGLDGLDEVLTPNTLALIHNPLLPGIFNYLGQNLSCPKVLQYHNITPSVFYEPYNIADKESRDIQYSEIAQAALYFPYAWGDSEYNCKQLREAGYARTAVANPSINFERYKKIQEKSIDRKQSDKTNILFVGSISPHKRQNDIIRAFYYYHMINQNSELTLVGGFGNEVYKNELIALADGLKLPVNFTGMVSVEDLVTYYQNADLFLCMSEHEGFCIPLIEAMYFGVPVIAFESSAVPETVANAGIVFGQKHFPSVAHLMDVVLNNSTMQEKMRTAGRERAMYFCKDNSSKRLLKLIEDYADELKQ